MNVDAIYRQRFGTEPLLVRAPGRINLIGEHTDYNQGFVLPAAIDKYVTVAIGKNYSSRINLYAANYNQYTSVEICEVSEGRWRESVYVLGVFDLMKQKGLPIGGFNMVYSGDVPIGAGLSSSAALECAVALSLSHLFDLGLSQMDIVEMAQRAEHKYAGVKCGIMDQFSSVFGKQGMFIKLDCRSLDYEYIPVDLAGYKLVLLDTGVSHLLAESEYNQRRQQCERGVDLVQVIYPQVNSLRDVSAAMAAAAIRPVDELVYLRCLYVIEENQRLLAGCDDLKAGDLRAFGRKMFATHRGLSREYGVSCAELDFLVDNVRGMDQVLGARMMGGGFGGCTINLVHQDFIPELLAHSTEAYGLAFGKELKSYVASLADGAQLVDVPAQ